jgi:hypothetical protein
MPLIAGAAVDPSVSLTTRFCRFLGRETVTDGMPSITRQTTASFPAFALLVGLIGTGMTFVTSSASESEEQRGSGRWLVMIPTVQEYSSPTTSFSFTRGGFEQPSSNRAMPPITEYTYSDQISVLTAADDNPQGPSDQSM